MKKAFYILAVIMILLPSCKKNSWLDWKAQNIAWLAKNQTKDSVCVTPTGLQYKVIRQGIKGTKPDILKSVSINYTGRLITGDIFEQQDSATFAVDEVIEGLQEGLKKMNKSGHYVFYIPAELAYKDEAQGDQGYQNYIPPYSTLVFDVVLLDVY